MSRLRINKQPVLSGVEAIIFDKDGTLIDVHHYWSSMLKIRVELIAYKYKLKYKAEVELMSAMGIDTNTGKIKPEGPVGIKSRSFIVGIVLEVLRTNNISASHDDIEGIFLEADRKTSRNMTPLLRLLPGVRRLLEDLKKCGIMAVLATTDMTSRASLAMKTLNIEHFFCEIIGGDAVVSTKPAPDLALSAIEKLGINSNKAVVIGDHAVDIKMGTSANVGCNIGVLTGLSDIKSFLKLNCLVVENLKCVEVSC